MRKQDWTAVVVELVVVVLGVFIGLQASNWNAEQADSRLGRDYVARLTHDLEDNLASVQSEIAYYGDVLNSVQQTDALLQAADPDPRALVVNAYRATEIIYNAPQRATWDQIVSSGHLDLLPAGAVESGLSQYYAFDTAQDIYRMGFDSAYRQTVRSIMPMRMQIAMRATCSDALDKMSAISGFVEHCEFKADPASLKDVAAALQNNQAVAADLRYQYSFAVSAVGNLRADKASLSKALAALGAMPHTSGNDNVGKRPSP
ncbi:MAG: hypothetical protein ABIQ97_06650 [Lysobacteraceae bacterium]